MPMKIIATLTLILIALSANAQTDVRQRFGDFNVHYSVFNSRFIDPQIASVHGLTRGDDIAMVNIAVTRVNAGEESLGLPAEVQGRLQNLIMQSRDLEFVEIREGGATYYLADFRIDDEDPQHFYIDIRPQGVTFPFKLEFTRTLYVD